MSEQPKKPRAPKKKRLTVFLDNEADEKLTETVGTSRTRRAGFVRWLMDQFHNDGDLGRLFASYNGGPGWLSRWVATQPADIDPLLLLETLPRAQSRDYAERVLSHMALCRKAYGQATPELDALASGRAAIYTPLDVHGPTTSATSAP